MYFENTVIWLGMLRMTSREYNDPAQIPTVFLMMSSSASQYKSPILDFKALWSPKDVLAVPWRSYWMKGYPYLDTGLDGRALTLPNGLYFAIGPMSWKTSWHCLQNKILVLLGKPKNIRTWKLNLWRNFKNDNDIPPRYLFCYGNVVRDVIYIIWVTNDLSNTVNLS